MLTAEITHICMQTSDRNFDLYLADPVEFLHQYVTMDEAYVYYFETEMK